MPIRQYTALFSLLGTIFGGDGRTTFGLPNLLGRAIVGSGQGPARSSYVPGQMTGTEVAAVTQDMLGVHTHGMNATTTLAGSATAVGNSLATLPAGRGGAGGTLYSAGPGDATLATSAVQAAGGSQAHENRQPFLALRYVIALQGIFPQRP